MNKPRDLSIFALIAADANVSPAFVAAVCRVGSERRREIMEDELADQRADERREREAEGE